MHARVLDVLRDRVQEDLAIDGDRVDVNLAAALDELGDDDRLVARDLRRVDKLRLRV